MQMSSRIEVFIPTLFSNKSITDLTVYIVKECHLVINTDLVSYQN